MPKRKSYTLEFKRSVLEWMYEDEEKPRTSYAAEQHFRAQGHNITKQVIHGWLPKRTEIYINSSKNHLRRRLGLTKRKGSVIPSITASPKRKSYTLEFKRSVLEWIYENEEKPRTSYAAEQHFRAQGHNITKQVIHGWLPKRTEIYINSSKKARRLHGGGNKPILGPDLEDLLKRKILEERQEGKRVSGSCVKRWALELAVKHHIEKFNASCGWLHKFFSRNELSQGQVTDLT